MYLYELGKRLAQVKDHQLTRLSLTLIFTLSLFVGIKSISSTIVIVGQLVSIM